MNIRHCTWAIALLLLLSACGGGGGGDDQVNFGGVWNGDVVVSRDTCAATLRTRRILDSSPLGFLFEHQVAQNDGAVQLLTGEGVQFLGNAVGEDGFSVDAVSAVGVDEVTGADCQVDERIRYGDVNGDDDDTSTVVITKTETCSNGFSCVLEFEGTAARNGPVGPTPTPTADPNLDEMMNGDEFRSCADLQQRVFTGDGGCGISEAEVSISTGSDGSDLVLIDSFGMNGASSFSVSESDPTSAVSSNVDLMINGEPGYMCSISCDSNLTFLLSCFQEGGMTCEERF